MSSENDDRHSVAAEDELQANNDELNDPVLYEVPKPDSDTEENLDDMDEIPQSTNSLRLTKGGNSASVAVYTDARKVELAAGIPVASQVGAFQEWQRKTGKTLTGGARKPSAKESKESKDEKDSPLTPGQQRMKDMDALAARTLAAAANQKRVKAEQERNVAANPRSRLGAYSKPKSNRTSDAKSPTGPASAADEPQSASDGSESKERSAPRRPGASLYDDPASDQFGGDEAENKFNVEFADEPVESGTGDDQFSGEEKQGRFGWAKNSTPSSETRKAMKNPLINPGVDDISSDESEASEYHEAEELPEDPSNSTYEQRFHDAAANALSKAGSRLGKLFNSEESQGEFNAALNNQVESSARPATRSNFNTQSSDEDDIQAYNQDINGANPSSSPSASNSSNTPGIFAGLRNKFSGVFRRGNAADKPRFTVFGNKERILKEAEKEEAAFNAQRKTTSSTGNASAPSAPSASPRDDSDDSDDSPRPASPRPASSFAPSAPPRDDSDASDSPRPPSPPPPPPPPSAPNVWRLRDHTNYCADQKGEAYSRNERPRLQYLALDVQALELKTYPDPAQNIPQLDGSRAKVKWVPNPNLVDDSSMPPDVDGGFPRLTFYDRNWGEETRQLRAARNLIRDSIALGCDTPSADLVDFLLLWTAGFALDTPERQDFCAAVLSFLFRRGASCAIHPLLRGFIDYPSDKRRFLILKEANRNRLTVPPSDSDESDDLAVLLHAFPNRYVVRLSPTKAWTLEFIQHSVVKEDRVMQSYVTRFNVNLLATPQLFLTRCPYALARLVYACNSCIVGGSNAQAPIAFTEVPLLDLLVQFHDGNKKFDRDLIVLSSFVNNCDDAAGLTDVQSFAEPNQEVKRAFRKYSAQFAILQNLFLDVPYDYERSARIYTAYIDGGNACETLFPAMTNWGANTCAISPNWMLEDLQDPKDVNTVMQRCYQFADDQLYANSLWECRNLGMKAGSVDTNVQTLTRQRHIWHLVRWLGLKVLRPLDAKQWDVARVESPVRFVIKCVKWMLKSGHVYPFATVAEADTMIAYLGSDAMKSGAVVRFSTSQSLAFTIRTHKPNPNYDERHPYEVEKLVESIPFAEWYPILSRNGVPKDDEEWEFRFRLMLFRRKTPTVLVRSLSYIEAYLESCGHDLKAERRPYEKNVIRLSNEPRRDTKPTKAENPKVAALLSETTAGELARLDRLVKDDNRLVREWKKLRALTLFVNARGEKQATQSGNKELWLQPGANDAGPQLGQSCINGYARVEYREKGDVNKPECLTDANWMYSVKLVTLKHLTKLRKLYEKKKKPVVFLDASIKVWNAMRDSPGISRWCTHGRTGDRNLTFLLHWLGPDCIRIVAKYLLEGQDHWKRMKTPIQQDAYIRWHALQQLCSHPMFDPFLTPPEMRMYANMYPGFMISCLSGTVPGAIEFAGYSATTLGALSFRLELGEFKPFLLPEKPFSIPFPLLMRVMVFNITGIHLAYLSEPKKQNAALCGGVYPEYDLRALLKDEVDHVVLPPDGNASNDFVNTLGAAMLRGAAKSFLAEKDGSELSYLEQRFLNNPERGAILKAVFRGIKFVRGGMASSWAATTKALWGLWTLPKTWSTNRFLFGDGIEAYSKVQEMFRELLWPQDGAALKNEEGFVVQELKDILENGDEPTLIPSFVDRAEEYRKEAEKFRRYEFRGAAIGANPETFQQLFPQGDAPATDDPRIVSLMAKPSAVNDGKIKALLTNKQINGLRFGPQEKLVAERLGVAIPGGKTASSVPVTAAAATAVAPPPGQRWVQPAGPMTDFNGPPYVDVKDPKFSALNVGNAGQQSDYFKQLESGPGDSDSGFEESTACFANGPNYIYPAFDVDASGRIKARCGRSNWMSDVKYNADLEPRLDTDNRRLLREIKLMAKHWCPTFDHQIRLWHWMGPGCLGATATQFLAQEALDREASLNPEFQRDPSGALSALSIEAQQQMLNDFVRAQSGVDSGKRSQEKCKKRIIFLTQMISSNILFPYVRERAAGVKLSGLEKDRVVLMLHWSKPGYVVAMRMSSTTSKIMEREYDVTELVNYMQFVPTTVRLRLFYDFAGGICATNFKFYNEVLKPLRKDDCTLSLADMRRFALRAVLPLSHQLILDEIYTRARARNMQLLPEETDRLKELKKMGLLIQSRNLTATEYSVFDEILKLENVDEKNMTPLQVAETAGRLYKSKDVDSRVNEAETFENFALCQRPEFVPYLRKKLKDKYPELKISDIEAMSREELCQTLVNSKSVELMRLPVYLTQVIDMPQEFRNEATNTLDLWNESKREQMNLWLLRTYGTTVDRMREDNKDFQSQDQIVKLGENIVAARSQRDAEKMQSTASLLQFRKYLQSAPGDRCTSFYTNSNGGKIQVVRQNVNGEMIELCDPNGAEKQVSGRNLMGVIYQTFTDPGVPLLMADFEFLSQSFAVLRQFFILSKQKRVPELETSVAKLTPLVRDMYAVLFKSADDSEWRDVPLFDKSSDSPLLQNRTMTELFNKYLKGDVPIGRAWINFRASNPEPKVLTAFTLLTLIKLATKHRIL